MATLPSLIEEIDRWFSRYFEAFIAIASGKTPAGKIVDYWGVPLHMSGPATSRWITTSDEVIVFLSDMQGALKKAGYEYTKIIDKKTVIYNDNGVRVETIMSRCRGDGTEMDRAAVSFEIRRRSEDWIIISTSAQPTASSHLHEVW